MRDGRLMPLLGLLLIGGLVLLVGCDSDETAPNDPLPELTTDDVANQAAIPAVAMTQVGPALAGFDGGNIIDLKTRYSLEFGEGDDFQGILYFDFENDGVPVNWNAANWAHMWTEDGEPLSIDVGELATEFFMSADVTGDPFDPVAHTTTLNGSGIITIGDYDHSWTIEGVEVASDGFPEDGVLTFTAEGITVEVHYDGDQTAAVYVDDVLYGTINLGNGTFQEI